jgi:uracil-DNA glycosylase
MSDAHDLLRRYLEQRRELGESEFALDSMSVDEALALIGKRGATPKASAPRSESPRPSSASAPPAQDSATAGDWRSALAATGIGPESKRPKATPPIPPISPVEGPSAAPKPAEPARPAEPAPQLPPVEPRPGDKRFAFNAPEDSTTQDAPDGLVVGQFGGTHFAPDIAAAQSLDDIARLVAACAACSLGATKTRDVVGEGNPNADFVVVGEAPGENEDLSGRPFVGASGQLLTKILAAIQLPREQVYICNVIKHRPPGNRNPSPAEVTACSPFLLRQLELVKPKVILAVGTFAAQTLLRTKEPIGKLRGRVHRYFGVPLVVTYHPAALLRNPTWKRPTWDDVQLARRILDRASNA